VNWHRTIFSVRRGASVCLCGLVLAGAPALNAQSSSDPDAKRTSLRRFSFGVRASVFALDKLGPSSITSATTSPVTQSTWDITPTSQRLGGGVSLEFALSRRFALSADLLYHRFAYQLDSTVVVGVDNPETIEDERRVTTSSEQTRAHYWDLPVLVRFYAVNRRPVHLGAFFDAGIAMRLAKDFRSTTFTTLPDATTSSDTTARTPANKIIRGVVGGGGFRLVDDFGIRVIPEVRYTRWLADTWAPLPARVSRNQLEVLVGIMF
jgi:hypothetical protein